MEVSLTPQSEAFLQQAVSAGQTTDQIINAAIELLQQEVERKEHHAAWLSAEIQKGEASGVLPNEYDFECHGDRSDFWTGIDSLSDRMLTGEISMRPDSAALPPLQS